MTKLSLRQILGRAIRRPARKQVQLTWPQLCRLSRLLTSGIQPLDADKVYIETLSGGIHAYNKPTPGQPVKLFWASIAGSWMSAEQDGQMWLIEFHNAIPSKLCCFEEALRAVLSVN